MTTAVLLAAVAATMLLVGLAVGRRRRPVPSADDVQALAAAGFRPVPGWLAAVVVVAALGAAVAAGLGLAERADDGERADADQALANRSTCQSQVAADWRAAIDVLLIGAAGDQATVDALTAALADEAPEVAAEVLDGASTPEEFRNRGVDLVAESLTNDARIGDPDRPLCPYVPGDPDRTPTTPDRTELAAILHPTTTTTEPG